MGKKKAIRIIFQENPIETGREYPIVFEFRIRDRIEVIEVGGVFEGVCRCTVDGQDTVQTVINVPLDLSQLLVHQVMHKGKSVLPSGIFRVPGVINIATDTPGSIRGKFGAIAYRFRVHLKARKNNEEAMLENEREIDVIGSVSMSSFPEFEKPVHMQRHLKRKFLCFNILDANVKLEIEKAAFMPGEHVLVSGEVTNGVHSSNLRSITLELRQRTAYKSGDGTRNESHTIRRAVCGACPSGDSMKIHHSLQVPPDLYPTLLTANSAIQVTYSILVASAGYFEVEVPIFVGNRTMMMPRAIRQSASMNSIDSFEKSSFCSSSLHSDPYYYVPFEEFSDRPPPYPGRQAGPYFIPIHVQPRVFRPVFEMPFREFPPQYSPPLRPQFSSSNPSQQNDQRFLKIEEID
ncbi:unnamed protein product, partial [Mesorhabditis belari]|uniref:Arrestin C-terminal-like domain-containing protein n=1 Tax=Mesorhabditis belari TaxID=2138241 RepID=A0AAF3FGY4_9BILA